MRNLRLSSSGLYEKLVLPALLLAFHTACSDDSSTGQGDRIDKGIDDIVVPNMGDGDGDDSPGGDGDVYVLPDDFTKADKGGYRTVREIKSEDDLQDLEDLGNDSSGKGCGTTIVGVVRDFKRGDRPGGHPDFEQYTGNGEKGILEDELRDDKKPVLAPGDHEFITSEDDFYQWYNTESGINRAFLVSFSFEPNGSVLTFHSTSFFPIDDMGFGNEDHPHNYGFTTEVHTEFVYRGGESFSFDGDDDLWVYINGRLAIDLGGLHPAQQDTVRLDRIADDFALEVGETYALDLFHAERHTAHSNFRVDTNLEFTNCGIVLPDNILR